MALASMAAATPAFACQTSAPLFETAEQAKARHDRDRRELLGSAEIVATGTWSSDPSCTSFQDELCHGHLVVQNFERGEAPNKIVLEYTNNVSLCSMHWFALSDDFAGRFYLSRSDDREEMMIVFFEYLDGGPWQDFDIQFDSNPLYSSR